MIDGRTPVLSDNPRIRRRGVQERAVGDSPLGPKVLMMLGGRLSQNGMGIEDLARQGCRLLVDQTTPLMVTDRAPGNAARRYRRASPNRSPAPIQKANGMPFA